MRKKIGLAFVAIFTLVALQWAVASVDTQPAATQQVVSGKTVQSADGKVGCDKAASASCPKGEATTTTSASTSTCPKTDAASCDKAGATTTTTSTSTEAVDCTKAEGAKCPYSTGTAKS